MRIAIYENLPPGGAKRASFEFGRFLAQRHEVDLYRLSITDNRAFDLAPLAHQVYTYRYAPLGGLLDARLAGGHYAPRSYTLFGPLRRLHRRIAADLQHRAYDIVLAHTDAMSQSPYLLRWLGDVPSVYYCQEVFRARYEPLVRELHRQRLRQSRFPLSTLRLIEDAWVLRQLAAADAVSATAAGTIAVNSQYSRERVAAAYRRDAVVCYLGVDSERFQPDRSVTRRREVLSIGSPPLLKGHGLVIDALGRIPEQRRPALRIVMAGRDDAAELGRQAHEQSVTLTIETGLDEAALIDRYRAAIATICAARMEPFGLTALESMACGTPVIAINEGGYRESVRDGITGLLVEPTADGLAAGIERLANDPQQADALGRGGRASVIDSWTWEHAGRRLDDVLRRAAAAS
jgi:glycosyltransferase involved in cell wall biosynthesis